MLLSLVMGTINREREIYRFLASQLAQTHPAYQIIIVDQNENDSVERALSQYSELLPITHLRTSKRGLSRARNLGLAHVAGEIVGFPDDDCWYKPTSNALVIAEFTDRPEMDVLCGCSVDAAGQPSQGRWRTVSGPISRRDVWTSQTSYTSFYRAATVDRLGGFDESLGVGAGTPWGSGEETDLLIRALDSGSKAYYCRALEIHHPDPVAAYDRTAIARTRSYSRGLGHLLRRHRFPWWWAAYMCVRPAIGSLVALSQRQPALARYRLVTARARLAGYLQSESD
jgi:glycosyltransferase involved in cell wall biosynthesis